MAKRLLGKEVNEALVASLKARTAALGEKGITPLWASSVWARTPLTCPTRRVLPSVLKKLASL